MAFFRISGQSGLCIASWSDRAPRLYALYSQAMDEIQGDSPQYSAQLFSSSAFAAATLNMDEETATVAHLDYLNYIFGWEAHPDKLIWETDRGEGNIWVITVGRRVGLFWDIQIVSDLTMGVPNATFHKFYHLDEAVDWYRAAYNHLPGHQPLKIIMPTKFPINMLVNDHDVDIRDFDVDITVTVGGYNKVQFSVQPILAID
ncbi:hypothetical protein K435DRAFT_869666 [Dendrothele bispora CBS 962.96]|uniref:Uncharacterized protein n=1 Tax=Dendrothele bispora (strain CBS 962.96) TaxID=1314807 RepID=A0A4S8L8K8_DENBC|nr:hypothetical protein K435DRAFT_869666 [Dendrothele bispora CBS 962.96]